MGVIDEQKDKSGKSKPPLLPKPCVSSSMAGPGEHVIPQMIITSPDDISEEIANAAKSLPVIAITESEVIVVEEEATTGDAAERETAIQRPLLILSSEETSNEKQLQHEEEDLQSAVHTPLIIKPEKSVPGQQDQKIEHNDKVPIQAPTAMQRPLVFDGSKAQIKIDPLIVEEEEQNEAELQLVFNSSKETKDEVSPLVTDKTKGHSEEMKTKAPGFLKKHGFPTLHFGGKDSAETHTEKVNAQSDLQKEQDSQHGIKHFFTSFIHESGEEKKEKPIRQDESLESPKEETHDLKQGIKKFFDSFKHDTPEQSLRNKSSTSSPESELPSTAQLQVTQHDDGKPEARHVAENLKSDKGKSDEHTMQQKDLDTIAAREQQYKDMKHSVKKFFDSFKHDSSREEKSKSNEHQDQKELECGSKDIPKESRHSVKKFFESFKHEVTEEEKEKSSKHNQPLESESVEKDHQKESKHGLRKMFDSFTHKEASHAASSEPTVEDGQNNHIYDDVRSPDSDQDPVNKDEFKRHKEGHHGVKKLFDSFRHKDAQKPVVSVSEVKTDGKSMDGTKDVPHAKVHFENNEPSVQSETHNKIDSEREETNLKEKSKEGGHSFKQFFGSFKEKDSYKEKPMEDKELQRNSEIPDVQITFDSLIAPEETKPSSIFSSFKPKFMSKEKHTQSKEEKLQKDESRIQEYDLQNAGTSDEFPQHVSGSFKPLEDFSVAKKLPLQEKTPLSKSKKSDQIEVALAPRATVENGYETDEHQLQQAGPTSKEPGTPESLYETCCVRLAVLLRNKALDIVAEHTKSPPKKPPKPSAESIARARAATVEKRVQDLQRQHLNFGDNIPIGFNGIRYADDETESSGDYKDVENLDYIMDYELVNRYKFDNKLDTFSVPSTCSGMTSYYTADTATLKDENFSDNALETVSLDSRDSYLFKHLSFVQAKSDVSLESLKEFSNSGQLNGSVVSPKPQSASPTFTAQTGTKRVPPPIPPKPVILPKTIKAKSPAPKPLPDVKVCEVSQCVNGLSLSPRLSVKGKGNSVGTQKRPLTIAGVKETEFSSLRKTTTKGLALKDRKFDTVLKNESLRNLPSVGPFKHLPLTATKSSPPQLAVTKSSPDLSLQKISPQRPPPPACRTLLSNNKEQAVLKGSTSPKAPEKPKRDSAAAHSIEEKGKRTASPPRPPPPVLRTPVQSPSPHEKEVSVPSPVPVSKPPAPSPPPPVLKPSVPCSPPPPATRTPVRSPPPRPPPPVITSSLPRSQAAQQSVLRSERSRSLDKNVAMVNGDIFKQDEELDIDHSLEESTILCSDSLSKGTEPISSTELISSTEPVSSTEEFPSDHQYSQAHISSASDADAAQTFTAPTETLNDNEIPTAKLSHDYVDVPQLTEACISSNLKSDVPAVLPIITSQSSEVSETTVKPPQRKPKPPPRTRRIRSRTVEVAPSERMAEPRKRRSQSLSDVEEVEKRVSSLDKLTAPEKVELKHLYTAVNKNGKKGSALADADLKARSSSLEKVPSRPLPAPPPPPRKFRSLGRKPKEKEKIFENEFVPDSVCDNSRTVSLHDSQVKPPVRRRKGEKQRFFSLGSSDAKENIEPTLEEEDENFSQASSVPFRPERHHKHYAVPRYDENANVSFPVVAEVHHSESCANDYENEVFDFNSNQNIPCTIESELPVERIAETIQPHPRQKKPSSGKAIQRSSWYDERDTSSPKPTDTSWEILDWTPGEVIQVKPQSNINMRRRSDPVKKTHHASKFYVDVQGSIISPPLAVDKETSPLPLDCSEKSVQTSLETLSHGANDATSSREEQSDDTDELLDLAQTLQNELKTIINRHKTSTEYNESEDSQTPPLSAEDKGTLSVADKKVKKNDSVRSSTSELWQMTSSEESEGEGAHGGSANLTEIALTRKQKKIFYVAQEIMTSEEVFVDALKLLNSDFKAAVDAANKQKNTHVIPDETLCQILNHLPQLQHLNENLLMELKDRIENWDKVGKIADIIVKMGPFLKLYSWFIHDFESTVALLEESKKKYPLFAQVVSEFERSSRCKRLTLNHFLLKPIQRIPQYRLLLQEYLHHLPEDSLDYQDTITALQIVSEVANHANDSMKQGDNVQKLFSIQNSILGHKEIIKPGRVFIKEGELMKLSRKGMQPRWFVLLNDMLLYLTPVQQGLYRVNHELALTGMKVAIPIQQDYQNEFSIISVTRSFTLASRSPEERQEWIVALTKAIEENASKRSTFTNVRLQQKSQNKNSEEDEEIFVLGRKAPVWIPDARVTMCQLCTSEFTVTFRRHHCRACGKVVCSICSSNRISLPYLGNRIARVCDECHIKIGPGSGGCTESGETDSDNQQIAIKPHLRTDRHIKKGKRNLPSVLKEVCANDQGSTISGYLQIRSGKNWKRDWFVVKDKVLYEYKASEDVAALRSVPLLGYQVESFNESYEGIDQSLLLKLTHPGQAPIIFHTDTASSMERWVAALKEASVLE